VTEFYMWVELMITCAHALLCFSSGVQANLSEWTLQGRDSVLPLYKGHFKNTKKNLY